MQLYLTRDADNTLNLCDKKLKKMKLSKLWDLPPSIDYTWINLPEKWCKGVRWKDEEPTQVQLNTNCIKDEIKALIILTENNLIPQLQDESQIEAFIANLKELLKQS